MQLSNQNAGKILEEIASEQVTLICGKHNYVAARKRANGTFAIPPESHGCVLCWKVYFVTQHALTAPNKRQESLDELEAVVHHAVEYEQKGSFGKDLELYGPHDHRFRVQFEKDAADDDTGEDKVKPIGEEELN
jgi:hypothetical protein